LRPTAPQEKPNCTNIVSLFCTMGGHQMRRELRAPRGAETLTYSFHFQISNNGGRQAFSVEVQAPNVQDATRFFRQNLPGIESMARDHLANGIGGRRALRLAAVGDPNLCAARAGRLADQRRRPRKSGNSPKRVEPSKSSLVAAGVKPQGQGGHSEPCPIQGSA
jgi:hypothetical protein